MAKSRLAGFSRRYSGCQAFGLRRRGDGLQHRACAPIRLRPQRRAGLLCKVPRNRGKNLTLIASMTFEEGMGESMVIEGSTTSALFEGYVENFLAPTLEEGQIVMMDNLKVHKAERVLGS